MKKLRLILVVTLFLSVLLTSTATAEHAAQTGNCPNNFKMHHFMQHGGEPHHRHIGLDRDLNGDGYICVFPINSDLHLHIDNNLP